MVVQMAENKVPLEGTFIYKLLRQHLNVFLLGPDARKDSLFNIPNPTIYQLISEYLTSKLATDGIFSMLLSLYAKAVHNGTARSRVR